ncbi:MAG: hypothetical protein WAO14_25980 [Pseudolabrys sp.]
MSANDPKWTIQLQSRWQSTTGKSVVEMPEPARNIFYSNNCPFGPSWKRNAMGKFSAVAFIITIIVPLPAFAYTQNDVDACTPDAMRLCWNAIPDAGRVTQCLVQNKQQLSPACGNVFNRPRGASIDRERTLKAQGTNY